MELEFDSLPGSQQAFMIDQSQASRSVLEESKGSICVEMEFDLMMSQKSSFVKVYAITETQESTMMSSGVASSGRTFTQSSLV